jgi:phosphoesterase RecJ-like protein
MIEQFIAAGKLIEKATRILSISHKRPDGDTLGASCALYLATKNLGKEVFMACIDDIPARFQFLPDMNKVIKEFDFRAFDLIFVSDAGASYMTRYQEIYPDLFKGEVPVINFDHHASNDYFGSLNLVDINSASTTILLYKMFQYLGIKITADIATALLCGIYNDTGSLMHSNTTLEVFEITGKLMELGGKLQTVSKNLFKTTPVSTLKVWGKVLENAVVNSEGVTISVLTNKDLQECGAKSEEVSGAIDLLNSVPGAKFSVLLNEDEKGNVKGSFRTSRDDIDLAKLAGQFGGGGHKKASGFTMPGRIHREIRWKVIPEALSGSSAPESLNKSEQGLLGDGIVIPIVDKPSK